MAILTKTWNTAEVGAAGNLESNLSIGGGVNEIHLLGIQITPSESGGLSSYQVYSDDTFAGDIAWEAKANAMVPFYDPVKLDEDDNMSQEGTGYIGYLVDEDGTAEFHIKISNQAAVGRTYEVKIWYAIMPIAGTDYFPIAVGSIPQSAIANTYGLSWNESADTYVRTGSLAGRPTSQTLAAALLPIQAAMRRCVLNDAGEVQYYLGATDSTKREDGVIASDLTGTDGQVMVQIPAFYYKYGYSGTTHTWEISLLPQAGFSLHPAFIKNGVPVEYRYIGAYEGIGWDASASAYIDNTNVAATGWSGGAIDTGADILSSVSGKNPITDETRAEFRAIAANRGTGWRQQDFDLTSAIQLLYLVEYADWNSQAMIGQGRTQLSGGTWTKDSYIGVTGKSNADGNGTNSVDGNTNAAYMTYRGIENFFGNIWKWVDGINVNDNVPYVSNDDTVFADDTAAGYTALGITLANANGYQVLLEQQARGFLPASADGSGSSSTYITDYYYQNTGWRVVMLGGNATDGAYAGVAYWNASHASASDSAAVGGRLCF